MVIQVHRYEAVDWFPDHYAVAPRELVTLIAAMSTLTKLRSLVLVVVHDLPPSGV